MNIFPSSPQIATMNWYVLCANPIIGQDWTLSYPPFIGEDDVFSLTLTVAADVPLPTQPTIHITAVNGWQTIDPDNVIEVSH